MGDSAHAGSGDVRAELSKAALRRITPDEISTFGGRTTINALWPERSRCGMDVGVVMPSRTMHVRPPGERLSTCADVE